MSRRNTPRAAAARSEAHVALSDWLARTPAPTATFALGEPITADSSALVARLSRQSVGASLGEVAALESTFADLSTPAQLDLLGWLDGISDRDIAAHLAAWRAGNPFHGVLPFIEAATLSGDPADDVFAISAGTGLKIATVPGSVIDGGAP